MEDTKIKAEAMAQYIRHKKEFENDLRAAQLLEELGMTAEELAYEISQGYIEINQ